MSVNTLRDMEGKVQYQTQPAPEVKHENFLKKAIQFFAFAVASVFRHKETVVKKTNRMTDKEEFELLPINKNFVNSPKGEFERPSMYEAAFLQNMIAGEFDDYTEDSFSNNVDKVLFRQFNTLSKNQKVEKLEELKKAINAYALQ